MIKELPIVRINTDSKENTEKINVLFQSNVNSAFEILVICDGNIYPEMKAEPVVEVFYSENNSSYIQRKISEVSQKSWNEEFPVLFMCDKTPNNLSLLIIGDKPAFDFIMLPADMTFVRFKIDQLIISSKQYLRHDTEMLLEIQHKIEFHNWFQSNIEDSLKYLLNTLIDIDWIDGGGIYFFNEDNDTLVLTCHLGLSDDFIKSNKTFQQDSPPVLLIKQKKTLFTNYKNLQKEIKEASNPEKIKALAILPLIHNNDVIGCINLASKTKEEIPGSDQVALEAIASKIATIISFLKTHDELKKAKSLLETKVNQRTWELKDVNQLLQKEVKVHQETSKALAYSESLYRSIFNNANDGIVLYDAKSFKPVDVNPKVYVDLGYTRDEFMKLKTSDFTIYESDEYRKSILRELFSRKQIEYYVKHKTKSNEIKYRVINASIISLNNNDYIVGIIHDITRLRLVEFEIQQKEKQIKSLQENISIGLFRTDIDGTIIYANNSLAGLLKWSESVNIVGKSLGDFVADPMTIGQVAKKMRKTDLVRNFEMQVKDKLGKKYWVLLNLKKIKGANNETQFYDGSVEDISTLKNTQLKLEKANRKITKINKSLEEKILKAVRNEKKQQSFIVQKSKLESLGELAAGIAHEVNQPLGIMTLAFENLQLKLQVGSASEEYINNKITSIISNIDRIRDIINHIRIFSREQDSIVMQKVDVNSVINDVLKLITTQYLNHNITIKCELCENPGFTIGSILKLEQVLLNLLSNAKYAVEENESNGLTESPKMIKLKTDVVDNRILLLVEDNGSGMDDSTIDKIFDPFFTTKPEWVGTGLGLSITYGIIKDMHGSITVKSKKNKFTRFEILFPRFPEKD